MAQRYIWPASAYLRDIGPPSNMTLLFDGILPTGRRLVEVQTVYLDRITGIRTLTEELPLRIWGDDPRQPEHVVIECLGLVELS